MANIQHNFDLAFPLDVTKFAFPLTRFQEDQISRFTNLFDRNLQFFTNHYHHEGKKVLLVTNDIVSYCVGNKGVEQNDLDRNCIYSGKEGGGLQNCIAHAVGNKNPSIPLKELTVFAWNAGSFKFKNNSNSSEDIGNKQLAFAIYYDRLIKFIQEYKPDTVLIAGVEAFEYFYSRHMNDFSSNKRMLLSRLFKSSVVASNRKFVFHLANRKPERHHFKFAGTVDALSLISWSSKATEHPNLIGFFSECLTQVINGRNNYTVHIPQDVKFVNINTIEKFKILMKAVWKQKIISIDTETSGLGRVKNTLYTIQLCFNGRTGYVVPVDHPSTPFTNAERRYIKDELRRYFETGRSLYHIYQNGKFDLIVFYACIGMRFYNHRLYDIQAGEYALNENLKLLNLWNVKNTKQKWSKPYALDFIAERYGCSVYRNISFSKGNRGQISTEGLTKRFIEYGAYDVIIPFLIHEKQIEEAKKRKFKKFLKFVCEQLSDTFISLAQMEHTGLPIDKAHLFKLKSKDGPIAKVRDQILEGYKSNPAAKKVNKYLIKKMGIPQGTGFFGEETWVFNLRKDEHKQLFFFKALDLKPIGEKKLGGFQTNAKFLKTYADVPEVAQFSDYQKSQTLKNNVVDKAFDKMKNDEDCLADQRLRSVYDIIRVSTGRLSCLDGDTPVYVLDSRGQIKIKDVVIGDWIWAFDKNLKPVPQQVSWSGQTGLRKTLTITYQAYKQDDITASCFKTLVCTPEHLIHLRDGSYVKAQDLKPGDRILSVERRYSSTGYRYMQYTGMEKGNNRHYEHRIAMNAEQQDGFIIHHKDEIKDNNIPTNLQKLTQVEHARLHGKNVDFNKVRLAKTSKTLKAGFASGRYRCKNHCVGKFGKDNPLYKPLDKAWAIKTLADNKWHPTVFSKKYGMGYADTLRKLDELGIDWKSKRARYNGDDVLITKQMIKEASHKKNINEAAAFLKVNYYKAKALLAHDSNHEVVKIEYNTGVRPVYDITVPIHHNFIANGINVHNSFNLNLQNIPVRGPYAKHIKRMFAAGPGKMFVKNDFSAHEVRDWANQSGDEGLIGSFYVGMKYRQELRVLTYKYEQNLEEWFRHEKRVGWHDKEGKNPKHNYEAKINFISQVNDPITQEIGRAVLELEAKGDLHRLNCERFFKVNSLLVTDDQRYEIKAVVFGVIYGKGAMGLAKPKSELGLGRDVEYCQGLIDSMAVEFPTGWGYLAATHKFGRENLYIESPLGMQRHLPAYLHSRPAMQNAMDRRGPNSSIQGVASCMGVSSIRFMQKLMWHYFIKHDVKMNWKTIINDVHDSVESEVDICNIPLYTYMMEHASSTLIHKRYRDVFDYELKIGLELEFGLGATMDRVDKWDFTHKNLFDKIESEMEFQKKELGYDLNIDKQIKKVKHNWQIVRDIRLRELECSLKTEEKVSMHMFLTEKNCRNVGLIFQ